MCTQTPLYVHIGCLFLKNKNKKIPKMDSMAPWHRDKLGSTKCPTEKLTHMGALTHMHIKRKMGSI